MGTLLPPGKPKIVLPALEKLMEEEMSDLLTNTKTDLLTKTNTARITDLPGSRERTTEAILNERAKTHGDYSAHARITQRLKAVLYEYYTEAHTTVMRESLEMNMHKIGRILAGDPDFRDHWDDMAGYSKLAADRCSK